MLTYIKIAALVPKYRLLNVFVVVVVLGKGSCYFLLRLFIRLCNPPFPPPTPNMAGRAGFCSCFVVVVW